MEMRGKLPYLLLFLALTASLIVSDHIFDYSVRVLQNCVMAVASLTLVIVALSLIVITLRQLEERSKVVSILGSSLTLIVGFIMTVAILYVVITNYQVVITNYQSETLRFLLACILGKSPQDNGILALSTLAITLIAIVFFAIMTLYGALSLKKLLFSKKLT